MLTRILITASLLLLPVALTAETRVDMDRSKDFSKYKTFTLQVMPPVYNGEVDKDNTLEEGRLRHAASFQLRARGLKEVASGGDLTVRVANRQYEQTELVGGPGYSYAWYGGWGGYWGAPYWGGPYWGNAWTYTYLEGTTRFDVIEESSGDLIYRADVSREVDHDEKDLNRDAMKDARKAFKKYPVGYAVDGD